MMVVKETGGGDFELPSAGLKNAVCSNVYDLGVQESSYGPKHQVVLLWELDELDSDGARHWVIKTYTASLNDKARLREDLETWRGKGFSAEELAGFDLEAVLDKPCTLNIVHNESKAGKTYANVKGVMPPQQGNVLKPAMPRSFVPSFLKERVLDWPGKAEAAKADAEFSDDIPFDKQAF